MTTQVVLLGTGNPNPDPDRSGPSVAVVADDNAYIVDAGPGVVRKASAAYLKGVRALRVGNLNKIFLTHLHSDHTTGLPDLMLSPWVLGRNEPLKVFGPPGTEKMVENITEAYKEDIEIRGNGPEKANDIGWRSVVKEIGEGTFLRENNVKVSAFRVHHGAWKHALGYRFETDDGTVVISGDCSPTADLVEHYRGADILVHEVYSLEGFNSRSKQWRKYHSDSHTSSVQLAKIAEEVNPGKLILYHQLLWGSSEDRLLSEIRGIYHGEVVSGKDMDIIKV